MYAYGVDVFHAADSYRGIRLVAHYFEFYLFITFYRLFDKNLRDGRKFQSVFRKLPEFFVVVGEAAAGTSESKRGTHYYRITYPVGYFETFVHCVRGIGLYYRLPYPLAEIFEKLSVLSLRYRGIAGTEKFDLTFVENTFGL